MSSETDKPVNDDLERFASQAETEDKPKAEDEAGGELVDYDEKEAARRAAESIISGMAAGAQLALEVQYPEEVKKEGVDKLAPCLEGGAMPTWLSVMLGKYGRYIDCGAWFAGVAFGTYQTVRQRNEEEAAADGERKPQPKEPTRTALHAVDAGGEGFETRGS